MTSSEDDSPKLQGQRSKRNRIRFFIQQQAKMKRQEKAARSNKKGRAGEDAQRKAARAARAVTAAASFRRKRNEPGVWLKATRRPDTRKGHLCPLTQKEVGLATRAFEAEVRAREELPQGAAGPPLPMLRAEQLAQDGEGQGGTAAAAGQLHGENSVRAALVRLGVHLRSGEAIEMLARFCPLTFPHITPTLDPQPMPGLDHHASEACLGDPTRANAPLSPRQAGRAQAARVLVPKGVDCEVDFATFLALVAAVKHRYLTSDTSAADAGLSAAYRGLGGDPQNPSGGGVSARALHTFMRELGIKFDEKARVTGDGDLEGFDYNREGESDASSNGSRGSDGLGGLAVGKQPSYVPALIVTLPPGGAMARCKLMGAIWCVRAVRRLCRRHVPWFLDQHYGNILPSTRGADGKRRHRREFVASAKWQGRKHGYYFTRGMYGQGYYPLRYPLPSFQDQRLEEVWGEDNDSEGDESSSPTPTEDSPRNFGERKPANSATRALRLLRKRQKQGKKMLRNVIGSSIKLMKPHDSPSGPAPAAVPKHVTSPTLEIPPSKTPSMSMGKLGVTKVESAENEGLPTPAGLSPPTAMLLPQDGGTAKEGQASPMLEVERATPDDRAPDPEVVRPPGQEVAGAKVGEEEQKEEVDQEEEKAVAGKEGEVEEKEVEEKAEDALLESVIIKSPEAAAVEPPVEKSPEAGGMERVVSASGSEVAEDPRPAGEGSEKGGNQLEASPPASADLKLPAFSGDSLPPPKSPLKSPLRSPSRPPSILGSNRRVKIVDKEEPAGEAPPREDVQWPKLGGESIDGDRGQATPMMAGVPLPPESSASSKSSLSSLENEGGWVPPSVVDNTESYKSTVFCEKMQKTCARKCAEEGFRPHVNKPRGFGELVKRLVEQQTLVDGALGCHDPEETDLRPVQDPSREMTGEHAFQRSALFKSFDEHRKMQAKATDAPTYSGWAGAKWLFSEGHEETGGQRLDEAAEETERTAKELEERALRAERRVSVLLRNAVLDLVARKRVDELSALWHRDTGRIALLAPAARDELIADRLREPSWLAWREACITLERALSDQGSRTFAERLAELDDLMLTVDDDESEVGPRDPFGDPDMAAKLALLDGLRPPGDELVSFDEQGIDAELERISQLSDYPEEAARIIGFEEFASFFDRFRVYKAHNSEGHFRLQPRRGRQPRRKQKSKAQQSYDRLVASLHSVGTKEETAVRRGSVAVYNSKMERVTNPRLIAHLETLLGAVGHGGGSMRRRSEEGPPSPGAGAMIPFPESGEQGDTPHSRLDRRRGGMGVKTERREARTAAKEHKEEKRATRAAKKAAKKAGEGAGKDAEKDAEGAPEAGEEEKEEEPDEFVAPRVPQELLITPSGGIVVPWNSVQYQNSPRWVSDGEGGGVIDKGAAKLAALDWLKVEERLAEIVGGGRPPADGRGLGLALDLDNYDVVKKEEPDFTPAGSPFSALSPLSPTEGSPVLSPPSELSSAEEPKAEVEAPPPAAAAVEAPKKRRESLARTRMFAHMVGEAVQQNKQYRPRTHRRRKKGEKGADATSE
eukprot:Hpha_TRINITY_DN15539_c7_g10::TRINITY_DN15539_c7_g10_i1::g.108683::m.108683